MLIDVSFSLPTFDCCPTRFNVHSERTRLYALGGGGGTPGGNGILRDRRRLIARLAREAHTTTNEKGSRKLAPTPTEIKIDTITTSKTTTPSTKEMTMSTQREYACDVVSSRYWGEAPGHAAPEVPPYGPRSTFGANRRPIPTL
jgi:hypothetical protein